MKRYRMTLTALTVSGALAAATVAPAAFAEPTETETEQATSTEQTSGPQEPTRDAETTTGETTTSTGEPTATDDDSTETSQTTMGEEEPGGDEGAAGDSDTPNVAKVAGILLPASLVIGGVTWYLNEDGETYVPDQDRTDVAPSPEEQETSEQMLNANAAEVIEQSIAAQEGAGAETEAPTATGDDDVTASAEASAPTQEVDVAQRGMAAETGNNTVPRALAALALLVMLGAAVPALRRRLG